LKKKGEEGGALFNGKFHERWLLGEGKFQRRMMKEHTPLITRAAKR